MQVFSNISVLEPTEVALALSYLSIQLRFKLFKLETKLIVHVEA